MLNVIDETLKTLNRDEYNELPQLAIHSDYHPGNLKFRKGSVVGLFDFDWSKIDVRCFDVALAMTYACTTWEGKDDGDLLLDRMILFLEAYQEEASATRDIGPLQGREIDFLPVMVKASNLYVLNWDVDDYYIKKPNPYEYLIYLQHNVRTMRWIEENWFNLQSVIKRILQDV
jgi:homoserine kinase type II